MKICKGCNKEMELELFYSHPGTLDGKMGKCKDCIKIRRRSPEGRALAREWEKNNRIRPEGYSTKMCRKYREENPEKYKAHMLVSNYFKYRKNERPTQCINCLKEGKIDLHHEMYSMPHIVWPLCPLCHSARHIGKLDLKDGWSISLPF